MPDFVRTTKFGRGKNNHDHIAYINEISGQGSTTKNNDHSHVLIWQQGKDAAPDP